MELHNDGTFVDQITDYVLMMKIDEQNIEGGNSLILHLDDWEDLINQQEAANWHRHGKLLFTALQGDRQVGQPVALVEVFKEALNDVAQADDMVKFSTAVAHLLGRYIANSRPPLAVDIKDRMEHVVRLCDHRGRHYRHVDCHAINQGLPRVENLVARERVRAS